MRGWWSPHLRQEIPEALRVRSFAQDHVGQGGDSLETRCDCLTFAMPTTPAPHIRTTSQYWGKATQIRSGRYVAMSAEVLCVMLFCNLVLFLEIQGRGRLAFSVSVSLKTKVATVMMNIAQM